MIENLRSFAFFGLSEKLKKFKEERKLSDRYEFLQRMMLEFGSIDGKKRFMNYYPNINPDELINKYSNPLNTDS